MRADTHTYITHTHRGSRVVAHTLQKGPQSGVEGCVFTLPNSSIVAVLANPSAEARTISVRGQTWTRAAIVEAPADSIVTVIINSDAVMGMPDHISSHVAL